MCREDPKTPQRPLHKAVGIFAVLGVSVKTAPGPPRRILVIHVAAHQVQTGVHTLGRRCFDRVQMLVLMYAVGIYGERGFSLKAANNAWGEPV